VDDGGTVLYFEEVSYSEWHSYRTLLHAQILHATIDQFLYPRSSMTIYLLVYSVHSLTHAKRYNFRHDEQQRCDLESSRIHTDGSAMSGPKCRRDNVDV
jgi:hypothetical protein